MAPLPSACGPLLRPGGRLSLQLIFTHHVPPVSAPPAPSVPPHAPQHKYCSPTRSSLQSGRLPIHVNVLNADMSSYNPHDPVSGFAGVPRNMTGISAVMKKGGYATHMVRLFPGGCGARARGLSRFFRPAPGSLLTRSMENGMLAWVLLITVRWFVRFVSACALFVGLCAFPPLFPFFSPHLLAPPPSLFCAAPAGRGYDTSLIYFHQCVAAAG